MSVTWAQLQDGLAALAENLEVWEGIPLPVPDLKLRVYKGHPFEALAVATGGQIADAPPDPLPDFEGAVLRNQWWSWRRNATVVIYELQGKVGHFLEPAAPDRSMARLDLWIGTIGACPAWSLEAELTARAKLRGMLSDHAYRCYELTGSFMEKSRRSGSIYLFRRNRPTVVLVPHKRGAADTWMKVLAVLCLHPIGYYEGTWAGAMVPTDDVIAHLTLMRGDEHLFWRKANHHLPSSPQAGL